jgi:hypothetical protein
MATREKSESLPAETHGVKRFKGDTRKEDGKPKIFPSFELGGESNLNCDIFNIWHHCRLQ